MSPQAWKHVMGRDSYTQITIDNVESAKEVLNICFGKDTSLRKELLIDSENQSSLMEVTSTAKKEESH